MSHMTTDYSNHGCSHPGEREAWPQSADTAIGHLQYGLNQVPLPIKLWKCKVLWLLLWIYKGFLYTSV